MLLHRLVAACTLQGVVISSWYQVVVRTRGPACFVVKALFILGHEAWLRAVPRMGPLGRVGGVMCDLEDTYLLYLSTKVVFRKFDKLWQRRGVVESGRLWCKHGFRLAARDATADTVNFHHPSTVGKERE